MTRFVVRRLLQMVITLLGATFVFYAALTVLPGDPVRALFGPRRPPPEVYEAVRREYRLDQPFVVQYASFVSGLVRGDFGHSYPLGLVRRAQQGPPVRAMLARSVPVSIRLLGVAVACQIVVGLAMGTRAAGRRRAAGTYALALGAAALPVVVVVLVLRTVLGYWWEWLPTYWLPDDPRCYVIPIAALATGAVAYVALIARGELRAILRTSYVKAAEARGVPNYRLVGVHAMRVAMPPIAAFVAGNLANLMTGLIVVEGMYGVPGVGRQIFEAIQRQDRAYLVVTITLILAVVIVVNTLADILHAALDPRIRQH